MENTGSSNKAFSADIRALAVMSFIRFSSNEHLANLFREQHSVATLMLLAGEFAESDNYMRARAGPTAKMDDNSRALNGLIHLQVSSLLAKLSLQVMQPSQHRLESDSSRLENSGSLPLLVRFLSSPDPVVCSQAVLALSSQSETGESHIFVIRDDAVRLISVLAESNIEQCQENVALALLRITGYPKNIPFILRRYALGNER